MKKLLLAVIFLVINFSLIAQQHGKRSWDQVDAILDNLTGTSAITFAGVIQLPSTQIGENVFTTTAETDTVTISGALSTDTYIISPQYTAGVDQQDVLEWEAITGKLVVHRLAAGESALKYSWLRIPTP
jgi:hypothetical protein